MNRPALVLQRTDDGSAYIGHVTEDDGGRLIFNGNTADEVVQQWEDRYPERPLSLALTEVERGMLVDLLRHEAKVVDALGFLPLRVTLLNRLAVRLDGVK